MSRWREISLARKLVKCLQSGDASWMSHPSPNQTSNGYAIVGMICDGHAFGYGHFGSRAFDPNLRHEVRARESDSGATGTTSDFSCRRTVNTIVNTIMRPRAVPVAPNRIVLAIHEYVNVLPLESPSSNPGIRRIKPTSDQKHEAVFE